MTFGSFLATGGLIMSWAIVIVLVTMIARNDETRQSVRFIVMYSLEIYGKLFCTQYHRRRFRFPAIHFKTSASVSHPRSRSGALRSRRERRSNRQPRRELSWQAARTPRSRTRPDRLPFQPHYLCRPFYQAPRSFG